ncbi:MAG TPA: YwiC-like family protein [Chloroflexia bacterium]|nr:YwiC-like family protein [Chloroflexia bacterium]
MLKTDATPQAARRDDRLYLGAPPIPDDHGAYAMLLLPMVIGFILGIVRGVAPSAGALEVAMACVLFAVALVALFFASEPLSVAFKPKASTGARRRAARWLAIYLAVAACAGAPLLFVWGLWGLRWFLVVAGVLMLAFLVAVKMRKQRSMALRLPGILCLTLSGPAAYYVTTGRLDAQAWGLGVACAVYFVGTIFNVRAWFEINRQKKSGISPTRLPGWLVTAIWLYLAGGALAVALTVLADALPWAAYIALVPSLLRAIWTLWSTPAHIPIKRIGLIEFAQSFAFAILLVAVMA